MLKNGKHIEKNFNFYNQRTSRNGFAFSISEILSTALTLFVFTYETFQCIFL